MKKLLLFFVITVSCVILSACSVTVDIPVQKDTSGWDKAWVGKNRSQIVRKFGEPEFAVTDGKGGEVSVYDGISVNSTDGDDSARFFIGSDGICTRVVPGAQLSSSGQVSRSGGPYEDEYGYESTSGSRSKWSFILDNALNILLLVSLIIWVG